MEKKQFKIFLPILIFVMVGFSSLFSFLLSASNSLQDKGNVYYYFVHQALFGLLPALVLALIAFLIPINFFKKFSLLAVIINIVCLFLVFLPGIGIKAGGASRWLNLGITSIQPAEFLKLSAILYLSAWIASKLSEESVADIKANIKKNYYNFVYVFIPFAVFLGVIAVALSFQRDASTLGIIAITLLAVYFASGTPLWHTLAIVFMGVVTFSVLIISEPYRLQRFLTFLNPGLDPLGKDHQITQSIISLGSGGFWGKGLGMSAQKLYIPEAMTDSIFAVIGEEMGLIGSIILIGLFIALLWAGIYLYKNSSDKFSRSVAIGIVCWISVQSFINIASSAGAFPLAGIPLPFFSYGGSHLAVELISMGLLLNIAKKI